MIVSFGVVIGSKYSLNQMSREFNTNIDCNYVNYTETLVKNEFTGNLASSERLNTYCFCLNSLVNSGYSITENLQLSIDTSIVPCKEWVSLFIEFNAINGAIAIIIPVVNSLLILFMKWLSVFEKSKTLTQQISSSMWKMFALQFINTGLVIVLVNIYIEPVKTWSKNFPLFTGIFSDLNPGWYSVVGVTILFTMLINVIVPHLTILLGLLVAYLYRCSDSGCWCGKKTNKKYKKEYFDLYVGPDFPIDVRYAGILTTIFVALVYSSGIPILYLCVLGYLIITFIVDKLLILRFYKSPPKYDLYVSKMFNIFIIFGLLIHYFVAIWVYGNPNLLLDNTSSSLDVLKDVINKYIKINNAVVEDILTRVTIPHNIICLIFLALLIVIFIIRITIFSFLEMLCNKKNLDKKTNLEIGLAVPLKSLYRNYELRKIQFMKFMKYLKLHEQDYSNLIMNKNINTHIDYMKSYFQLGINYDREFLKYKLEKLSQTNLKSLDKNFDEEIKRILSHLEIEEDPIIGGDVSFNIAVKYLLILSVYS